MKLFSLNIDTNYLIGNGDEQTFCLDESRIRNSFTKGYPDINAPLRFELNKKSNLTNCLSQSGIISKGFLIDSKTKLLLDSFSLMNHRFYPAEILVKGDLNTDYYWLQLQENLANEIDYKESTFIELDLATKIGEIKLESFLQYESFRKDNGWKWNVEIGRVKIKSNSKLFNTDLFNLLPFDRMVLISERLKNKIEKAGLTGFKIEEYDKVVY